MDKKKIYDISIPLRAGMPVWPGDPGFKRTLFASFEKVGYNVSMIMMGSHTGTHVDAPAHFIEGGATVDTFSLDVLVGQVIVFELAAEKEITRSDLEVLDFNDNTRVLFKTRNSSLWELSEFTPDFISFAPDAAQYLVDKGIKLVGIDYLSVGSFYEGGEYVHRIFLGNGVVVIESINLLDVPPGTYELMCLPLRIIGGEGAPARVLLKEI